MSQTFKSNHAHTQRTQNEQNQWKSNQSLLHVPESRINIQGQNGVPLQPTWGEFQALTHCEFIPEITKQNTPVIPVRGTYRNSSPTLLDFGQPSFSIHSNNTRNAERCAKPPSTCNYTSNIGGWMRGLEILPPAHTHTHTALSEMHRSLGHTESKMAIYGYHQGTYIHIW